MLTEHYKFWPKRVSHNLTVPETTLYNNLAVSAARYPDKTAIYYYGQRISYRQLYQQSEHLAGYLQHKAGVQKGDRVLLYLQNSPQFVIGFHAILRSDAVVLPVNPMNLTDELKHYIEDSGARVAIVGQELYDRIATLTGETELSTVIVATYSDYLPVQKSEGADNAGDIAVYMKTLPEFIRAPRRKLDDSFAVAWSNALDAALEAAPSQTGPSDLAVMPYTSGTTGAPKGCMHTNRTVQANTVGACNWVGLSADGVILTVLPLFHVTGMVHSMLAPIFGGSQMVLMTRWDRDMAGELIQRTRCTGWTNISTMVVDFLMNPKVDQYDISSLQTIGGGGATLPEAVGEQLFQRTGIRYMEGYGLSETISQTHFNPPDAPKLQCMGIPSFDVDARILDTETGAELGPNQEGELVVNGPQVFVGYWNRPADDAKSFIEIGGKRFFRTGDLARYDEDGYFFMVDRVKRMINAAGFKVWPSEVETILYKHPAVGQACVIGVPDLRRGETVKAYIIPKADRRDDVTAEEIISWAREQMAAYKVPRVVQFVDSLPMSGSGKILWRKLQEDEAAAATPGA
ncbi:long-chain fatty acid--CoA ligase [Alicyclobacillus ferrooxydans]|uniref:Long-chain fatty acid--CoA ligase n=1 Tax=Alicyclobacillus ferrooxydans TaxID=471514 RepID=A0A0N8PPJ3_9BACL|nr:long-chain fatty acid--CoA ligase [Alicyclobacillus ferrooxydans]KPV44485.1 long-chain fatty acid--CoA ligase [Alicyclobacillus ferrooxydans]